LAQDLIAERLDRSKYWIVKQALSAWIEQEEERSHLTREALADVDAGSVMTIKSSRPVLTVSAPTLRCRCRADGIEVDKQGVFRHYSKFW
jgi:predicted transcriptional regulator